MINSLPRTAAAIGPGITLSLLSLMPSPAAAHAFGQRYDLPMPLAYYIWGGGAVVFFSFVVAAIFLRQHKQSNEQTSGFRLVSWQLKSIPVRVFVLAIEILSVAAFLVLLFAGFWGYQGNPNLNILPLTVWILWWIGLAFISALIGNLWDAINPWAIIARWFSGLAKTLGLGFDRPPLPYPKWLAAWPAFLFFSIFAWMEIAWPTRIVPAPLATVILVYSAITWTGMALFGRTVWLQNAEAFSLFFGTFARFAPLAGWRQDGRIEIVLRPPSAGLLEPAPASFSHMALVLLIFSTVAFDGIRETSLWLAFTDMMSLSDILWPILLQLSYILPGTAGVQNTLGFILILSIFMIVFLVFSELIALAGGRDQTMSQVAYLFVFSLVPIAVAYHLAHYLSFILIYGQSIFSLISDPFGWGWNLFGTAGYQVNIGLVGPKFGWLSAAIAIIVGHVAAVFVAHFMALRLFIKPGLVLASQIPMLVLMIAYTMVSLWILAQPIVG